MKSIVLTILFTLSLVATGAAPETSTSNSVSGVEFDADFYVPKGQTKNVAVLVLGGSEGGIPKRQAQMLAKEGYPVLALGYFKTERTPDYLDMIPLEYFDAPIKWLNKSPAIQGKPIVIMGGSKGGELALLLASRNSRINGVIASAPSFVVFQGIPKVFWPPRSSWSYDSKPLPFVPYDTKYYFTHSKEIHEGKLLAYYQASLKNRDAVEKATISVEKINGPVLLFSGSEDSMWPSSEMCDKICRRLEDKQFKYKFEHIKYNAAGHTLNEYFMIGGTEEGNKKARIDSTQRMFDFLNSLSTEHGDPSRLTDAVD